MQQPQQSSPTLSVWHTKSTDAGEAVSVPFSYSADFSVRPTPPLSVGPHFTPKKRGRPPKASPFLDIEFGRSDKDHGERRMVDDSSSPCSTSSCKDGAYSSFHGNGSEPLEDPKTDDVFIGAYLLSQLCNRSVPTCVNCHTRRTPLWRKGWRDGILKRDVLLCNACGLKYSKRQYCCYCKFIYNMKEDVLSQQSNWMDCDSCRRWVHIDCELRYGNTFTFDGRKYHGPSKYFCPDCQHEQKQQPQTQQPQQILPKPQTQQQPQQTQHQLPPVGQVKPLPSFTLPLPLPNQQRPTQQPPTQQPFMPSLPLPNIAFSPNNGSVLPGYDKLASQGVSSSSSPFFPTTTTTQPTFLFNPGAGLGSFGAASPKPEPMAM